MSYHTAKNCFQENVRLTGGAVADPVSFNLYTGLYNLTQQLERDIHSLQQSIQGLEYQIGRLK